MKKFFFTLFILILLAGGIFLGGWSQLRLTQGAYGLLRSKTHGIDPALIRPGEFRWIWYLLIPANAEVVPIRLEPVFRTISVKNTLPSGNFYAAFAGLPADFSWEINGTLSFSLDLKKLAGLAAEHNIGGQEELDAFQQESAEKIEAYLLRKFGQENLSASQLEEIAKTGSSVELEREVLANFPFAESLSLSIKNARFPDFRLYAQVRGLYEEFIVRQRENISAALKNKTAERVESLLRYSDLELYGGLFEKYPSLLDYLAIEHGISPRKEADRQR